MLRWNSALRLSLRMHFTQSTRTDPLLSKLKRSTSKFHVFQLVGIHRPILNLKNATYAMNLLLKFQDRNLRNVGHIQEHPEFVSLCSVIEKNICVLEDRELVHYLHIVDSFELDGHCSLVQQLITEGWKRLQRFDLLSLSTFAAFLRRQNMTTSPLMGHIASIVDSSLDDLEDPVILSRLLYSLHAVSSPCLQEQLMGKTMYAIEKLDASHFETVLQLLDVLSMDKDNISLMKKCDKFFLKHISALDSQTICNIMKLYNLGNFTNQEFSVAAKARLMKEVENCDHPDGFADLFVALRPMVSLKITERLDTKFASFADHISLNKLQDVVKMLAASKSTNAALIQKICSRLWEHMEVSSSDQLYNIAKSVWFSGLQDDRLQTKLQFLLKRHMLSSYIPSDIAQIMEAITLLNPYQTDEVILSKLHRNLTQFSFLDLGLLVLQVRFLLQNADTVHKTALQNLLKALNSYRLNKVNEAKCLDSLLFEMRSKISTLDAQVELVEAFLQRLIHQLSWKNVTRASVIVFRLRTVCPALQDRIATIVMDNLDKLCPSVLFPVLRIFSYMNHKPPQGNEFFHAVAQHILNGMDALSPYYLVGIAYHFSVAGYFHEELIKAIFNINFLQRFDAQVDAFITSNPRNLQLFLMELNRAICIEHPEYGVPWFHEQYCQRIGHAEPGSTHHEICKIFNEIFGGQNYVKMCVKTPYCYFIDLEYVLDKEGKPIAYEENDALHFDSSSVHEHENQLEERKPLPAGAQRYAVTFLSREDFLGNSTVVRGTVKKKKIHLEMLGYHVIQIPVFLLNFTTYGTKTSLIDYLRKRMFADGVYKL